MNLRKKFKILAIDGGGIRGIYAAHILKRIKDTFKIDYKTHFDLITGTSTGAIIAAGLAIDYPIEKISQFYEKHGQEIFLKRQKIPFIKVCKAVFKTLYDKKRLKELLDEIFKDKIFADLKSKLLIPVTDISNGTTMVIKSIYDKGFVRDGDIKLSDAILASCSAPIYFKPSLLKNYLLADGGLWANNPALVGLTEAISPKIGINIGDIKILSIGTGQGKKYYNPSDIKKWWGFTTWGTGLISTILNIQSISVHNILSLMMDKKQYLRLNNEFEGDSQIDDVDIISSLKAQADKEFTYKSNDIKNFINGGI